MPWRQSGPGLLFFPSLMRTRAPGRSPRHLCLCTDGAAAPGQGGSLLGGGGAELHLKGAGRRPGEGRSRRSSSGSAAQNTARGDAGWGAGRLLSGRIGGDWGSRLQEEGLTRGGGAERGPEIRPDAVTSCRAGRGARLRRESGHRPCQAEKDRTKKEMVLLSVGM